MENKIKRIGMCTFGVFVCAVAVGVFKLAAYGVDPFQSLMSGIQTLVPIPFGTLYLIVNAILLLFALIADRHYIHIATFINLFLLGYIVDFSYNLLMGMFPNLDPVGRMIALVIGVVTLCFGSSFYFVADLGVSTYDAISLIISKTWKLMPFKYCRIISDVICVLIACALFAISGNINLLWASVGIGTIITAFFMGPLIDFFVRKVASPFLNGK